MPLDHRLFIKQLTPGRFQASDAMQMRYTLFWDVAKGGVVIFLPTFRDILSVPSSTTMKMWCDSCK